MLFKSSSRRFRCKSSFFRSTNHNTNTMMYDAATVIYFSVLLISEFRGRK